MNRHLVEKALERPGLSKTGLARALGIPNSAVTALLKGDRRIKADEVPKLRKYLRLDSVPLKGFVGAGGSAEFYELPEDDLDRVPAPDEVTESTVAVQIRGESMGAPLNNWIVYYDNVQRPITRALHDKLCVVGLSDGRVLIKLVKPSKVKGLYHLVPLVGDTIFDVPIEWAARVKTMRPRD